MHQPRHDLLDDIENRLTPLARAQEPPSRASGFWDVSGPEMVRAVLLDQDQLRQINVSVGKGGNSVGMLKEEKLYWPLSLQGPKQQKIAGELPQLIVD